MRRVQGTPDIPEADSSKQREIVSAFLAASRSGDFEALLEMLDPEVVVRADETVATRGAASLIRGAAAVAENFSGRAQAARLALVDGLAGAVWAQRGVPKVVFAFTINAGRITEIELLGDADYLEQAELTILEK